MATDKPRINFSMEPRLYEALKRVAVAEGRTVASVVRRALQPSVAEFERIADDIDRVQRMKREAIAQIGKVKSARKGKATGEDAPDGPTGPTGAPAAGRSPSPSGAKSGGKL